MNHEPKLLIVGMGSRKLARPTVSHNSETVGLLLVTTPRTSIWLHQAPMRVGAPGMNSSASPAPRPFAVGRRLCKAQRVGSGVPCQRTALDKRLA
jgi:hypothetical protein